MAKTEPLLFGPISLLVTLYYFVAYVGITLDTIHKKKTGCSHFCSAFMRFALELQFVCENSIFSRMKNSLLCYVIMLFRAIIYLCAFHPPLSSLGVIE